jgi:hypothetical protein
METLLEEIKTIVETNDFVTRVTISDQDKELKVTINSINQNADETNGMEEGWMKVIARKIEHGLFYKIDFAEPEIFKKTHKFSRARIICRQVFSMLQSMMTD